ncbi:hypothetical protein GYMLUDRAFT_100419 [Collybiopsis luxurians FD-317 M1]|uniref:Glucose-methanol-choline oxidoreductase N-terminal domain-containing protein n=1 Tax=Collybiopsis luxurians FD-317 M1 TaxID=944289 RepID=A0A0D0AS48_9AGAR|nr:hypothetical protein GYMLUDRAFT_100419 [Collybiopsis luxurians FD-317 M1]
MGNSVSRYLLTHPIQFSTPSNEPQTSGREFDVVIVGGGTAGCVLASRLSENPSIKVLLIEAGSSYDSNIFTRAPLAFTQAFKTAADWAYETTAQGNMNGRKLYVPRGKILGGSSAINAMVYHHCSPSDFDRWDKEAAPGWSYKELLPYFLKSERYSPSPIHPKVKPEDRGHSGLWLTGHASTPTAINSLAVEACQNIGIPYNDDLNAGRGCLGVANFIATLDSKGSRSSTATAYLTPDILSRPNLFVAISTVVEKVLFEKRGDSVQASGVEISTGRTSPRYRVTARSEVVLCAGAIGTPQLLLLSGIGPAAELKTLDIHTMVDLPAVGKHLNDHISSGSVVFPAKPGHTWDRMRSLPSQMFALFKWLVFGTGPLSAQGAAAAAFVRSDDKCLPYDSKASAGVNVQDLTTGPGAPDIELYWLPSIFTNYGFDDVPASLNGISMGAVALMPESEGSVTLISNSVWDHPLIDPNHLASENDLNVIVRGIRLLLRLARTEPLKSVLDLKNQTTDVNSMFFPGDADPDKVTDEELKAFIKRNGTAPFHPVSSARMGMSPQTSVVNNELRVHGVGGLRVVDASAFPTQVSGHPQAVIVAMAEKAADMMKKALSL